MRLDLSMTAAHVRPDWDLKSLSRDPLILTVNCLSGRVEKRTFKHRERFKQWIKSGSLFENLLERDRRMMLAKHSDTNKHTHIVCRQSKALIEMSSLLEIVSSAAERVLYGASQTWPCVHPLLLLCKRQEYTHLHTHRRLPNNEFTRKKLWFFYGSTL